MRTIWKFKLEITDTQVVSMPDGAVVLSVGLDPFGDLCLWAVVDPSRPKKPESFTIFGTGNPAPNTLDRRGFIGTVVMKSFVWHVYAGQLEQ